jgi:WD40 repeat protein
MERKGTLLSSNNSKSASVAAQTFARRPIVGMRTAPPGLVPPCGAMVLVVFDDRVILADAVTKQLLWASIQQQNTFDTYFFCPSANIIVASDGDHRNCIDEWNLNTGNVRSFSGTETHRVHLVNWTGNRMLTTKKTSFFMWDLDSGTKLFDGKYNNSYQLLACFTADNTLSVVAEVFADENNRDESIFVLDVNTGQLVRAIDGLGVTEMLVSSPDGLLVAVVSATAISVYEVMTGLQIVIKEIEEEHIYFGIGFGQDNSRIFVIRKDNNVPYLVCWEVTHGDVMFIVPFSMTMDVSDTIPIHYSQQTSTIFFADASSRRVLAFDGVSGSELETRKCDADIKGIYTISEMAILM